MTPLGYKNHYKTACVHLYVKAKGDIFQLGRDLLYEQTLDNCTVWVRKIYIANQTHFSEDIKN